PHARLCPRIGVRGGTEHTAAGARGLLRHTAGPSAAHGPSGFAGAFTADGFSGDALTTVTADRSTAAVGVGEPSDAGLRRSRTPGARPPGCAVGW
ncbi:hypothetical protein, partial [Gordonia paraffinivorans]|uniref:hypothetical protein n=1 Tax=Gordonia paraffinivorans TaxID=175628 RepID=UPI00058E239F